jgi:hypothetical protein
VVDDLAAGGWPYAAAPGHDEPAAAAVQLWAPSQYHSS